MVCVRVIACLSGKLTCNAGLTRISCIRSNLKELAKDDEELAELLVEAKGDPDILEAKLKKEMDALHTRLVGEGGGSGEEMPPRIRFRDIDPFDTWVWMELYNPPTGAAAEMLQEVVNSWFMLGRLGAYDSSNLQVLYSDGAKSTLEYIDGHGDQGAEPSMGTQLQSTMHDMGEVEYQGSWARFWVDMGTSDELGFDILINALRTFSREHVGIRQIVFGGENDDWSIPDSDLFGSEPNTYM
jgi:hypothetical protein